MKSDLPASNPQSPTAPGPVGGVLPSGAILIEPDYPVPPQDLDETDGVPLESDWHRLAIALLVEAIRWHWRRRNDYYAAGNMFLYFSAVQARNKDYRGPDFFLVKGVSPKPKRKYWATWNEGGKYPNFIMELLSETTEREDLGTKKVIYEQTFHTPEYCCYDPETNKLFGWRLTNGKYEPIAANDKGWLWLNEAQLWLGMWHGVYHGLEADWPRFFDPQGNLILTRGEEEELRAEAEKQRADAEKRRADAEGDRAEAETRMAMAEKQRADALAEEVRRLKAQLAAQKKGSE